ncbi:MAG: pilus assembly protein N-terminal domain-containing protein [Planctomycetaceae bacterium]|nr:pilus assembly protein N-terminal domain-containing protein [Planctomycetaceae bacterium]
MQPFRLTAWKHCFARLPLCLCGLLFAALQTTTLLAQADVPPIDSGNVFHVVSTRNEMTLTERFARVVELDTRITRVDGFDPGILSVQALTPHRIRLQAVASGVTTLLLVDEFDRVYEIEVFVEGDVRHLQSYINRFFPNSSVTAVKVKDSVVLRGVVSDPSHITRIAEVAEEFYPKVINHMQFGAENQVRLQVRIMEAQRSRIRQLGFNWSLLNNDGFILSNPGNLATPTNATLSNATGNSLTYGGAGLSDSSISFGLVNTNSIFRGFIEALKQEGLLRILVESTVVADSGRPASLLSGGEFPILVPQALGTLSVEWREFGVKLEAVPIVLGQGQVMLEIAPEFSERDFANAATLNNTTIPAITTRRANTQVRMKFGQTLMIGGLIATRYTAETDKIPILGELPGIGAAFRRVRYDENETELIILVTPEYVAPLDPHQVPAGGPGAFSDIPTDRELFWQGLIEVPNYGGPTPPGISDLIHSSGPEGYPPGMIMNGPVEQYGPPPGMMGEPMMAPSPGMLPPPGVEFEMPSPPRPYGPPEEIPYPTGSPLPPTIPPAAVEEVGPWGNGATTVPEAPVLPPSMPPMTSRSSKPGTSQLQQVSGQNQSGQVQHAHHQVSSQPALIGPGQSQRVVNAAGVSAPTP